MTAVPVLFDKEQVAVVQAPNVTWNQAQVIFGKQPATASDMRECLVICKLLQAGLTCKKAVDPSHDVIVVLNGTDTRVDIKTLFPTYLTRKANYGSTREMVQAYSEELYDKIDSEVDKEKRQGCICLFDLSHLPTEVRQSIVGGIHNSHPSAITVEYDHNDQECHVICPRVFEAHRGGWYH